MTKRLLTLVLTDFKNIYGYAYLCNRYSSFMTADVLSYLQFEMFFRSANPQLKNEVMTFGHDWTI
jgi:hypothetical protein